MHRWLGILCIALGALACAGFARADTQVNVTGTWPAGDIVTLGRNQHFYLHLHYTSDAPTHIWARPYFQGKPVRAGSNPSRTYPPGSGEALGWFFLFNPGTRVDEVRISVGDGSYNRTRVLATYPVNLTGGSEPASGAAQPAWVDDLDRKDEAMRQAEHDHGVNNASSSGDWWLSTGFMVLMLAVGVAGFLAPAWGLWRWRGGWRIAAAVPAALMAFVVLRIIIDGAIDPTSHNLWPFEILMFGTASVAISTLLWLVRQLSGAAARRRRAKRTA